MRAAASAFLDAKVHQEILRLNSPEVLARIRQMVERGRTWGYRLDAVGLGQLLTDELHGVMSELHPASDLPALVLHAGLLLDVAALLGIDLDPWRPQNQLLDAYVHVAGPNGVDEALSAAFGQLADRLKISPALLGWRP